MEPAKTTAPPAGFIPNPKLWLREQLREVMRFKQFSQRTEEAYGQRARRRSWVHVHIRGRPLAWAVKRENSFPSASLSFLKSCLCLSGPLRAASKESFVPVISVVVSGSSPPFREVIRSVTHLVPACRVRSG